VKKNPFTYQKETIMENEQKIKVSFYDIDWDVDGANELPKKVELFVSKTLDIESDGAEVLSKEYGYLVNGFRFKVIN
jgi:hypothetical protein